MLPSNHPNPTAGEVKKALRTVIERYELPVRLTANQNLILTCIDPSWKADILGTLTAAGVRCAAPRAGRAAQGLPVGWGLRAGFV